MYCFYLLFVFILFYNVNANHTVTKTAQTSLLDDILDKETSIEPKSEELNDVYETPKDTLSLILMGDPQYYFPCEPDNIECKEASASCTSMIGMLATNGSRNSIKLAPKQAEHRCIIIESRYANRVQRQGIEHFIKMMKYKPSAMIINGDLTDYGHIHELREFKDGWIKGFPIPILAGLGNHDYDNSVDRCMFNFCAMQMLNWMTEYGKKESLNLQYERIAKSASEVKYKGSFAYSTRVCSITGTNCAHVIQLNNYMDYERNISSLLFEFEITSSMDFLLGELHKLNDIDIPVLINMHQCERTNCFQIQQILKNWILQTQKNINFKRRVAVFYAHMHGYHQLKNHCVDGTSVPFVYVGSVPNNRFSLLQITEDGGRLIGYATRNVVEELGRVDDIWQPCNVRAFPFRKYFKRRRNS